MYILPYRPQSVAASEVHNWVDRLIQEHAGRTGQIYTNNFTTGRTSCAKPNK